MTTRKDELTTLETPERVYYATGVFLEAEDMEAEQRYHRGRLARALAYLHGSGTVAGLEVEWDPDADELVVHAGLAIDRVGRLVEVPRKACVHLDDWLEHHRQLARNALGTGTSIEGIVDTRLLQSISADDAFVVADVFLRFVVCERGRTPAFATGPFDAIDATAPHRLRDSYELSLELRGEAPETLPTRPSDESPEDFEAWLRELETGILQGWKHDSEDWQDGQPPGDGSVDQVEDKSSVFLARVRIPVRVTAEDPVPERLVFDEETGDNRVLVDNHARRFVYPTQALARMIRTVRATLVVS